MTTKDQSEDEAAILTVWNDLTMNMCSGCERALYQTLVDNMRAALTAARKRERERCADLAERCGVDNDVVECIRALNPNPPEPETRPKTAEELAAAILSEMPGDFVGEIEALLPFAEALLACKEALEKFAKVQAMPDDDLDALLAVSIPAEEKLKVLVPRALKSLAALPLRKETQE